MQNSTTVKVFNLIVLDESGSMQSIKEETISTFNELIDTILKAEKDNPGQQHYVSFVSFNSSRIHTHLDRMPTEKIRKLDHHSYQPDAMTPLYDALGQSLTKLENALIKENDIAVLVSVITDGMENASKEFNRQSIAALIERLRQKGWTITYMGANQDAERVALTINIVNAINFDASTKGMDDLLNRKRKAMERYYSDMNDRSKRHSEKKDYFSDAENNTD
ncbi:MAG: VWA domain-containing protein [Bacteroidetes bacterium]|nr:VWA domain-containing protein [Bacteroidota bacterium]